MRLVIQSGNQFGSAFELTKDTVTIGRGANNDVVVSDIAVSRNQCQIRREASGYVMHDLGSVNGTQVNRQRIVAPHPLRVGDIVTIGKTTLRVEESQPPATPYAPQAVVAQVMVRPASGGMTATHWALVGGGLGGLILVGLLFAVVLLNQPPQVARVTQTPGTNTPTIIPVPPSATLTPSVVVTTTPSPVTPAVTVTPTAVVNPEATFTPIPPAKPTETPPKTYPAPAVLRPQPKEKFSTSAPVPFSWIAVDALRPGEMYRVQIRQKARDAAPQATDPIACEIRTRETYVTAPGEGAVCNDFWQFNPNFSYYWWVQVVLRDAAGNETSLSPAAELSKINEFIWAP